MIRLKIPTEASHDWIFDRVVPEPNTGCWLWTGQVDTGGYGIIKRSRVMYGMHRVSYQVHHGPIPHGMVVMHKCDNPPCVNPTHLMCGTYSDNAMDMVRKGRAPKYSTPPERRARGERHPFTTLRESDVRRIREMVDGGTSRKKVAKAFGVSDVTVGNICRGKVWRHVH